MIEIRGKYSTAKIMIDEIDEVTLSEIYSILNSDAFENCNIAIMPDTHAGKGSVVGFTSTIENKIIPNVVGVDIGCGIFSWNLGQQDVDFKLLDTFIHDKIPHGFSIHNRKLKKWSSSYDDFIFGKNVLKDLIKKMELDYSKVMCAIGSLGGGNHFIEVGKDPFNNLWLTVHSGSRNFGYQVAAYYQKKAKEYCENKSISTQKDLEYLDLNSGGSEYLDAMKIVQKYAYYNRIEMANLIFEFIDKNKLMDLSHFDIDDESTHIYSIHNYIDTEKNIIRKGAISSEKDERMLIPFNMRDGIAVVRGKGNAEWNNSAPHGAGRIYSRSKAKKCLDLEVFEKTMSGIYSTCVSQSTLDESPMAYKDKDLILNAISPTCDVEFLIKTLYNFKA